MNLVCDVYDVKRFACCLLVFARCLLVFACCSLLFAHCLLVFAQCLLLFPCGLLLFACCSLHFVRCSLHFASCSLFLIVAHYFLLVARYFLVVTFYFAEFVLSKSKQKKFSILICKQKVSFFEYLIGEKKTGHKINRVKLLVGVNFSHLHIKLVTFPRLNFGF